MRSFQRVRGLFAGFLVLGLSVGAPSFADDSVKKGDEVFRAYSPQTERAKKYFESLKGSSTKGSMILRERIGRLLVAAQDAAKSSDVQDREYVSKTAPLCVELWATEYGSKIDPLKADVAEKFLKRALSGFKGEKDEQKPVQTIRGLHAVLKMDRKDLQSENESYLSGEKDN